MFRTQGVVSVATKLSPFVKSITSAYPPLSLSLHEGLSRVRMFHAEKIKQELNILALRERDCYKLIFFFLLYKDVSFVISNRLSLRFSHVIHVARLLFGEQCRMQNLWVHKKRARKLINLTILQIELVRSLPNRVSLVIFASRGWLLLTKQERKNK